MRISHPLSDYLLWLNNLHILHYLTFVIHQANMVNTDCNSDHLFLCSLASGSFFFCKAFKNNNKKPWTEAHSFRMYHYIWLKEKKNEIEKLEKLIL